MPERNSIDKVVRTGRILMQTSKIVAPSSVFGAVLQNAAEIVSGLKIVPHPLWIRFTGFMGWQNKWETHKFTLRSTMYMGRRFTSS